MMHIKTPGTIHREPLQAFLSRIATFLSSPKKLKPTDNYTVKGQNVSAHLTAFCLQNIKMKLYTIIIHYIARQNQSKHFSIVPYCSALHFFSFGFHNQVVIFHLALEIIQS